MSAAEVQPIVDALKAIDTSMVIISCWIALVAGVQLGRALK